MKNSVFILQDRAIIYVNGPDAKDFLQNLITNDINKVTDNLSIFASLLTPQGKFLFDVGGLVFGISNTAVIPPAIAALLPEWRSSVSVDHGSLK